MASRSRALTSGGSDPPPPLGIASSTPFGTGRHLPVRVSFFFQAEDGIRDTSVTGVQTCALPIFGPDEPVIYPEHLTEELDYELELAVIIGKDGKWFGPEEAMDYVAGYVIFNDITARDIQRREMRSGVFSFCKAIDTFCPLGPWIVTPDEIPDPHDLAMTLRVNGETRQTSHS